VTPKVGGTNSLVLSLRPIVTVDQGDVSAASLASSSNVQDFEASVDVSVPWTERPAEVMTRIAATANVAVALVQALTTLIVVSGGLLAALGIRRLRSNRKREDQGPKEP
jgi:hypothetical protein